MRKARRRLLVAAILAAGTVGAWLALAPKANLPPAQAELWLHKRLMETIGDGAPPIPFASDGCSGGMSEVWSTVAQVSPGFLESYGVSPPWLTCCIAHDRAYWNAANAHNADDSLSRRLAADDAMRSCVTGVGRAEIARPTTPNALTPAQTEMAYGMLAEAMFQAVRLGGMPCSGLPWRWGFGYPDCAVAGRDVPPPRDNPGGM
jgi:hypothetical protein